ncbi:MAG TPA: terminase [Candidatus Blautia faecipullorum]|nr:terminase [Candidatus Blautia faecipullorum]
MPRAPDQRVAEAKELFDQGLKLTEIACRLGIPEGTVRSWKNRYQWDCNVAKNKRNVAKHRGGQKRNRNAAGHGAPKQNKNAEKYGFFSKYLPEETREIFSAISEADPLDLLWHQIQIAYAAIIRAQRIAYVKDQQDKTVEKVEEKDGNVIGERWEVQQAWDKQNEFLKAQARAQGELRAMIKQYDEMLNKDWEAASDEQRARINQIKAQTEHMYSDGSSDEDDGVEVINDAWEKTGEDIGADHTEISADI